MMKQLLQNKCKSDPSKHGVVENILAKTKEAKTDADKIKAWKRGLAFLGGTDKKSWDEDF